MIDPKPDIKYNLYCPLCMKIFNRYINPNYDYVICHKGHRIPLKNPVIQLLIELQNIIDNYNKHFEVE